jgi:hypothetical protein
VVPRAPVISTSAADRPPAVPTALPVKNRRTAFVLVAWIVVLMLASALVAWLRN